MVNGFLHTDHYVDLFNSYDAMIHDSTSFIAEYLYTRKPVLFINKNTKVKTKFNYFGRIALEIHYHAFNEENIKKFIENIILKELDTKESYRRNSYEKNLKLSEDLKMLALLFMII